MDGLILRLLPKNREFETQELILHPYTIESSILDTATLNSSLVYCDYEYSAQLFGVQYSNVSDLQILLNGTNIDFAFSQETGYITFGNSQNDRRIFNECYGYIQFTIIFSDEAGKHFLETEFVQVMVKKSRRNDSVRRMTEYVYKKNASLLYESRLTSKDSPRIKDKSSETLETSILILKQISRVFEENYRYFKANSRFVTVSEEHVDHFEKLQFVSTRTLQHIAQHPEELYRVPASAGIKIGVNRYQPSKTLITSNVKSPDIYENQVLVGFLAHINREIDLISKEISDIINSMPLYPFEKNDYVTSSFFIYADTIALLRKIFVEIKALKLKCESLYSAYSKILSVSKLNVCTIPKFTPIFKSVPQYHQIYDCIVSWFTKGAFSLENEKYMLSFLKISNLYEVYVLAKIINFYREDGYTLEVVKRLRYNFSTPTLYVNTTCNNLYVLKNDKTTVTVFYQPVIYNYDMLSAGGIGLYRNTSISFNNSDEDNVHSGKYYTPDYLIKYEFEDKEGCDYVIADAKFSTLYTVKNKQVPKLAYKYLFSISTCNPNDRIIELCIFNGQSEYDNDGVTNVYDYSLRSSTIIPQAEIVTLTENSVDNANLHKMIMRGTIGKYRFPDNLPNVSLSLPGNSSRGDETQLPAEILPLPIPTSNQSTEPMTASDEQPADGKSKKTKKPQKADLDPLDFLVKDLPLKNKLSEHLVEEGYTTFRELVPNLDKRDLNNVPTLNRGQRREIEANINIILRKCKKKLK